MQPLRVSSEEVKFKAAQALADSPTHELVERQGLDLVNGRKRNPLSRIFNATKAEELKRAMDYCEELGRKEHLIAWWKVVEVGDKIYVVGQWIGKEVCG